MAQLSVQTANLPPLSPSASYNSNVETLQNALMSAGFLSYSDFATGPGYYGNKTIAAVKAWQAANGYSQTGNFDSSSIASLKSSYNQPAPAYVAPTPAPAVSTPVVNNPAPVVNNPAPVVNNTPTYTPTYTQPAVNNQSSGTPAAQAPAPTATPIVWPTTTLSPNQTYSTDTLALQKALVAAGFMDPADMTAGAGYYGPKTTAAVTKMQTAMAAAGGMAQPTSTGVGVFGPATMTAATTKYPTASANAVASTSGAPTSSLPAGLRVSSTTPSGQVLYTANDGNVYDANGVKLVPSASNPMTYVPAPTSGTAGTTGAAGVIGTKDPSYHFVMGRYGSAEIWDDATFQANKNAVTEITYDQWIASPQKSQPSGAALTFLNNKGMVPATTPATNTGTAPISPTNPAGTSSVADRGTPLDANHAPIAPGDTTTKVAFYRNGSTGADLPASYYDTNAASTLTDAGNLANVKMTQMQWESAHPMLKPGDAGYAAAVADVKNEMWDVMTAQVNAKTEQEQQAAQYSWQELIKKTKKDLNINLTGNASQAYSQIEQLANTYNQQNTQGSGLQNESVDQYLRKVRLTDSQNRDTERSQEDQANMNYLKAYGTTQQIADFAAKSPDKAQAWGLIPSAEVANAVDVNTLMSKFGLTKEQAQQYHDSIIDPNGHYYSSLNQKKMTGANMTADAGVTATNVNKISGNTDTTTTAGDTGLLDIANAKKLDIVNKLNDKYANQYNDYNKANGIGTPTTDNAVSNAGSSLLSTSSIYNKPATDPALTAASTAAGNLGTNPVKTTPAATDTTSSLTNPTASTTGTPAAKKKATTYGTLYDYYSANGGWGAPTTTQRQADAAAAGITTGYTGDVKQNAQVLAYLNANPK